MRRVSSARDSVCSEGKSFGPADYIVRGALRRKAGTGFYRHFGNRVEACSYERRGLDGRIIFLNGSPLVRNAGGGGAPAAGRDTPSTTRSNGVAHPHKKNAHQ